METLKFYEGGYNPEKEYVLYKSLEDGKFKLEYYRVLTTTSSTNHTHANKDVLDKITDEKILYWDGKSEFDGDYESLINKPNIPSKTSDLTNDSDFVTTTEMNTAIANAQIGGGTEIDTSNFATKDELNAKVDKKTGYSLMADSEITRLSTVDNYDDTGIKNSLSNKSDINHTHSYNNLTDKPSIPSIDGLATETFVTNKIAEAQLSQGEIDLTGYATKDDLKTKADKTELHEHSNKTVLDGITSNKIASWDNKSNFSGNYNDLTNKPTLHSHSNKNTLDTITDEKIAEWDSKSTFSGSYNDLTNKPTIPVVDSSLSTTSTNAIQNKVVTNALNNKANSSHNHTIANITNLQTSLNGKSDVGHTHSYNDLSDKPTISTVDVTKSYVDAGLNKKVDKKTGYSLVSDSEIKRLSNVDNYDDTAIKASINTKASSSDVYTKTQTDNLLNTKANKTDLHSHSNKTVLDSITEEKLTEWDNKSSFSGNYNDLTNKPTIPKVDSVLSSTSTNAIQNKVVKSALDGKANSSHTHNISDVTNLQNSLDSKSDNTHTHSYNDLIDKPTIPTMPTIDSALSTTSTNPVQNKIITSALNNKSDKGHTHNYSDITNTPTIPTVDSALSTTSTNAIQNKVVTNALNNKANSSHTHNYAGSSSSGGSASSAIKLATSRKISLNGDASGSANFDGTSDITINTSVRKYCMVGSDVENSNGWYKVASETMSGYGDTNITFVVTSTYGDYYSGILQLQIRSDNTNISCKTLVWFNRYGFLTHNFIVNINNMTWTLYANLNVRYSRLMFEVISESSIKTKTTGITLFNSSTKESTTPVATVKSKDGGKVDNASTANKLATSRTLTIGKTGKTFDGSANVSWSLDEIGASASSHTHTISNVTNLQTTLDGKSNTNHTHNYAGSSSAGGDATNALACSGNATTATKLQTARTINGTSFDGSTNITTIKWGTARNITIGNTTKSINGSTNISWTLEEIGTSGVAEVSTVAELKSALVKGGTIHIKGGEYVLGENEELEYYSNTKLIGIGEVVIKVNPASASYIALKPHLDGTETGYTGVHNVTIENITMDGQGGTNNYGLFATAHCKNIDIKNCTFKNYCGRWHLVEINSSQNVKMTNCDITDYNYNLDSTDMFCTEAVQLDFAGDQGNYPFTCNLDNTGCQNITFESCNFKRIKTSWTAAVGSHTITEAYMPTNVTFTRCTFEDIDNCIYAPDFKNLVCDTCTIINAASFVIMHPSSRQNRSSCKIDNCDYSGWSRSKTIGYMNNTPEGRFFFQLAPENELSASKITNNTILGAYSHAIGISPNAATITGNSVKYSGKHGIYLYGGSQTTITGNSAVGNGTLEGYTGYDIYISVGSLGYIKRCNISNNASYVNTDGNTYESTRIADNL